MKKYKLSLEVRKYRAKVQAEYRARKKAKAAQVLEAEAALTYKSPTTELNQLKEACVNE